MNNKNIFLKFFLILIFLLFGMLVGFLYRENVNKKNENINVEIKDIKTDIYKKENSDIKNNGITLKTSVNKYGIDDPLLVLAINKINTSNGLILNKVISDICYNDNSNITKKDTESYLYLNKNKELTRNILANGEIENTSFQNEFNFDYKKCETTFDIIYNVLKNDQINMDLKNFKLDKEIFASSKNKQYIYEEEKLENNSLINLFMKNVNYDKITNLRTIYNIDNYNKNIPTINNICVEINYNYNNKEYLRLIEYLIIDTKEENIHFYIS